MEEGVMPNFNELVGHLTEDQCEELFLVVWDSLTNEKREALLLSLLTSEEATELYEQLVRHE